MNETLGEYQREHLFKGLLKVTLDCLYLQYSIDAGRPSYSAIGNMMVLSSLKHFKSSVFVLQISCMQRLLYRKTPLFYMYIFILPLIATMDYNHPNLPVSDVLFPVSQHSACSKSIKCSSAGCHH